MKHEPLRIIIISCITVTIAAIVLTVFFMNDSDKVSNQPTVMGNLLSGEDKNIRHEYIIVAASGKYTFADLNGEPTTEGLYDVLSVTDSGMYYYKIGSKSGFLDKNLRKIFETEDIISPNVSEGFVTYSQNDKKGFINILTGEKIDAVYDEVYDFSEGLAAVQKGGLTGFINTAGEVVIPFEYYSKAVYHFKEGLCNVMTGSPEKNNLKAFYIDKNGEKAFEREFDYAMPFGEERAFVSAKKIWFVIDKSGKTIGENTFGPYEKTVPTVFKEGRAVVVKDGKYGIIDIDGQYVVSPKYDGISEIFEGGVVIKQNGLYGYMDINGSVIIAPRYQSLSNFKGGLAIFSSDNKYGVVDRAATVIVSPEYEEIVILDNNLIRISENGGQYRYVNKYGKTVYEIN